MTTGLVLIAAVLVLGGVIATVGDRLGTKVGKARLTLFNMRPRKTATLITILTGGIISASTLGILFAVSDQLRTGVFELEKIQSDLRSTRSGLDQAKTEQQRTEQRLKRARQQQATAQRRLERINRSLQAAVERQAKTEQQLTSTQGQLQQVQSNYQQAQTLLGSISQQAAGLRSEIGQLQTDRQELIRQRDAVRSQIAERDQEIAQREAQLQKLESQRSLLAQEIDTLGAQYQTLDQEYQDLRQGNVAILRNQTLAAGVVRVSDPKVAPQALNRLLQEANQFVGQRIRPDSPQVNDQVVQLTQVEAEQLTNQIKDGKVYVIRILAVGNYVVGEPCVLAGNACVQVAISAIPNQLVFRQGQTIAATTVDPTAMPAADLKARINVLIQAAQFRARQSGILWETIQVPDRDRLNAFFDRLKQVGQPVEVQALAAEDAYTAGMQIELVGVQAGQIIFGTN
jgi:uncharacterized protein (DUF3084 family)